MLRKYNFLGDGSGIFTSYTLTQAEPKFLTRYGMTDNSCTYAKQDLVMLKAIFFPTLLLGCLRAFYDKILLIFDFCWASTLKTVWSSIFNIRSFYLFQLLAMLFCCLNIYNRCAQNNPVLLKTDAAIRIVLNFLDCCGFILQSTVEKY